MRALRPTFSAAPVAPRVAQLAEALVSAATELAGASEELVLQPTGAPVHSGRLHLGRVRHWLPSDGPVIVVVGFAVAGWLGAPGDRAPDLGRLAYRGETRVDRRGRVVLDRQARAWLAVADPSAFEVVVMPVATGGVLVLPVEGLQSPPCGGDSMTGTALSALCGRVRPELACLGDAGVPLVGLLTVVERASTGRPVDVLADPGFALEVLSLAGPGTEATLVGRILDFLRVRGSQSSALHGIEVSVSVPPLADAVAAYQAGGLALMDNGTVRTYRTWNRRLVERHPDADPRQITAGDLTDLIAQHIVEARQRAGGSRRAGLCAQEHAVHAYRHMWSYFVQKGWAHENVAKQLTKPPRPEPRRRDIRREEVVLLRHLALATSRDPLLDEVTLTVPERLGLRSVELRRVRLCDVDLDQCLMTVRGKLDKERTMPLPPRLADLVERYIEARRPTGMSLEAWLASEEILLRRSPTPGSPLGRPSGRRRIEELWVRLRRLAPDVFARGDISPHSYRHAVGTYVDQHYDRAVTRAILGHTSKTSVTDIYVHVALERRAEALAAYEDYLLAAEPSADPTEVAA